MSLYGIDFLNEKSDEIVSTANRRIEEIFGYRSPNGSYNALVKITGIDGLLRGRSEMLVLDETNTKVFLDLHKDGSYKISGGSWNENEDYMAAAIRETQEEMRINVKDIVYAGGYITYYSNINGQHNIPKQYRWIGTYTQLYIGTEDGTYTKLIAKKDQDDIYWKGKYYDIHEVYNYLNKYHKHAINIIRRRNKELEDNYGSNYNRNNFFIR